VTYTRVRQRDRHVIIYFQDRFFRRTGIRLHAGGGSILKAPSASVRGVPMYAWQGFMSKPSYPIHVDFWLLVPATNR
jgi:hypothetical protein